MKTYLIIILIGLVAAFIGIIPLLRKKADKYSVMGAFLLFFLMPYVIYHLDLPWAKWWWKGMAATVGLALPLIIMFGKVNSRCVFPMLLMSVIVGAFISFLGHFLL